MNLVPAFYFSLQFIGIENETFYLIINQILYGKTKNSKIDILSHYWNVSTGVY